MTTGFLRTLFTATPNSQVYCVDIGEISPPCSSGILFIWKIMVPYSKPTTVVADPIVNYVLDILSSNATKV